MKSPLLPLLVTALFVTSVQAQAALPPGSPEARLVDTCNARLDARMEGMTQAELDQVRRAEFGLRLALAPFRVDPGSMSERDRNLASADLVRARQTFARACGLQMGAAY